jgi:esterase/lipase superfamily enzyme
MHGRSVSFHERSARNLSLVIKTLLALPAQPAISVAAHSMGAEIVTRALDLSLTAFLRVSGQRLDEVLLLAAETTRDDFDDRSASLSGIGNISNYSSSYDMALRLSSALYQHRTGDGYPNVYLNSLIESVDASAAGLIPPFGHGYHLDCQKTIADLRKVLKGRRAPRGLQTRTTALGQYYVIR